jgi:RNA polymerase sigma factor (sigma-70 family)
MDIPEAEKIFLENSYRADLAVHAYCLKFSFLVPIREDLISEARMGLWKACLKYQPSSNNTFWTFAYLKVRGAIIDFIRKEKIWVRDRELKNGRKQPQLAPLIEHAGRNTRGCKYVAFGEEVNVSDPNSRAAISRIELRALIDSAMADAPVDKRDIVKDFYCDDVSVEQMVLLGASSASYARQSIQIGISEIKKSRALETNYGPKKGAA